MLYAFAPLEGITNGLYRAAHRAVFPTLDRYYTPFFVPGERGLSSKDLLALAQELEEGVPLVPQLLSNHSTNIHAAAVQLHGLGFSELNLNLGCPSGTVFSKRRGAGALADLESLQRFLSEIFESTPLPISIKTRIGVADPREWDKLLPLFNAYPLAGLIVHPRLREEYYRAQPHLDAFSIALRESHAPVSYSGDLFSPAQIESFSAAYPQTSSILLGRGLIANPALVATLTHNAPLTLAQLERFHALVYERYCAILFGEKPLLHKMKELWHYMICLFPDSDKHAKRLRKAQNKSEYETAVAAVFRDLTLNPEGGYHPSVER